MQSEGGGKGKKRSEKVKNERKRKENKTVDKFDETITQTSLAHLFFDNFGSFDGSIRRKQLKKGKGIKKEANR